jgi:hypothetical protein
MRNARRRSAIVVVVVKAIVIMNRQSTAVRGLQRQPPATGKTVKGLDGRAVKVQTVLANVALGNVFPVLASAGGCDARAKV